MQNNYKRLGLAAASAIILLQACERDLKPGIAGAMRHFDSAMVSMNVKEIGGCYAVDGELSGEGHGSIKGRDSIIAFLKQFEKYRLLKYTSTADSTVARNDSAWQLGKYVQHVIVPGGDTAMVGGKYSSMMIMSNGQWLISKMHTFQYTNLKADN